MVNDDYRHTFAGLGVNSNSGNRTTNHNPSSSATGGSPAALPRARSRSRSTLAPDQYGGDSSFLNSSSTPSAAAGRPSFAPRQFSAAAAALLGVGGGEGGDLMSSARAGAGSGAPSQASQRASGATINTGGSGSHASTGAFRPGHARQLSTAPIMQSSPRKNHGAGGGQDPAQQQQAFVSFERQPTTTTTTKTTAAPVPATGGWTPQGRRSRSRPAGSTAGVGPTGEVGGDRTVSSGSGARPARAPRIMSQAAERPPAAAAKTLTATPTNGSTGEDGGDGGTGVDASTNAAKTAFQASASANFSSRATNDQSSTILTLNIHMAEAFGRAQAIVDPLKLPWAKRGDILRVKPVVNTTGGSNGNGGGSGGSGEMRNVSSNGNQGIGAAGNEALLSAGSGSRGDGEGATRASGKRGRSAAGRRGDFLFRFTGQEQGTNQPALSVSETVAQVFGFANRADVQISPVRPADVEADYIELYFTGQYLGRADMWRLGMSLEDRCVHVRQKVEFAGIIRAEIRNIYRGGKKVASGLVTPKTKTIYRSKSAQAYIFLQLCREMWEFDEDGERYYEKALHGFLPELFQRWKDTQANHVVTIILFARVFYNEAEVAYMRGLGASGRVDALMHDEHAGHYKDFYKVLVDFETRPEWMSVMPILKQQMLETHEQILLNHHLDQDEAAEAKIVGRLSYAFEGNVLECLNLVLNPFDENYIDRDLSRTGLSLTVLTPGAGHFATSKDLLRLTTERMLDHGICLDLVCLTQVPLHITPLFSFWSRSPKTTETNRIPEKGKALDILYYDAQPDDGEEQVHYTLAFWVYCHFYSKTHDRPFREDRFIARCKMYDIQMLGVIDHDLTTLALPLLEVNKITDPEDPQEAYITFDEDLFKSTKATVDAHPSDAFGELRQSRSRGSGSDLSLKHASYRSQPFLSERLEATVHESDREPEASTLVFSKSPMSNRPRGHSLISSGNEASPAMMARKTFTDKLNVPPLDEPLVIARSRSPTLTKAADKTMSRTSTITAEPDISNGGARSPSVSSQRTSVRGGKTGFSALTSANKLFGKLLGRAAASMPTASVEVVERQDVSALDSGSPKSIKPRSVTSPAVVKDTSGRTASDQRSSEAQTRKTIKSDESVTLNNAPPRTETTPQAITIPLRGKSAEPPRRRLKKTNESPPSAAPQRRMTRESKEQTALQPELSRSVSSLKAASFPGDNSLTRRQLASKEVNPCRPTDRKVDKMGQAKRWQHAIPRPTFQQDVKWDSLCAPACLPLTNGLIPTDEELVSKFNEQLYVFDCQANQLSFLLRSDVSDLPIAVMREMASQRLTQNFQFIVGADAADTSIKRAIGLAGIRPGGASEVLRLARGPLWLSTPNQIHRLDFALENRNTLEVHNYTRRLTYRTTPWEYRCLVWPRQRKAYQPSSAVFRYPIRANDFNYLDRLISGAEDELTDSVRYWRTRFILIPSDRSPEPMKAPTGEFFNPEEVLILGATRLLETIGKARWRKKGDSRDTPPPKLLPTWLDPSACVTDVTLMQQLERIHKGLDEVARPQNRVEIQDASLRAIAEAMNDPKTGLIEDRWWHKIGYADSFQGDTFVSWLIAHYKDIKTREMAVEWGNRLQKEGLIEHCNHTHGFLDGYYFYRLTSEYSRQKGRKRGLGWFGRTSDEPARRGIQAPVTESSKDAVAVGSRSGRRKRQKIQMSQTMVLDLDPQHKSDRAEVAILHSDVIHNPANAFHFELNWIGVTAGLLDDVRQKWNVVAERHGLRLVEAPVEQIRDIGKKCAYRACFPIRLARPPPSVSDLGERLPEAIRTTNYFEHAILTQRFGFVLDVEATNRYPDHIEVEYSYRQAAVFDHSQFVHRSGVALIQCVGGQEGFLWSDNRLFFSASSRYRSEQYVTVDGQNLTRQQQADRIRQALETFCADERALEEFYESVLPPVFAEGGAAIEHGAETETAPPTMASSTLLPPLSSPSMETAAHSASHKSQGLLSSSLARSQLAALAAASASADNDEDPAGPYGL